MVIEPAKTEYRALLNSSTNGFDSICIFTVGNANGVPFRFNPLEFLEHETLSGHIDELKAASQKLLEAMSKAGQAIHQAAQAQQGQQQAGADATEAQQTASDPNEKVVDADYSEVKEENK